MESVVREYELMFPVDMEIIMKALVDSNIEKIYLREDGNRNVTKIWGQEL